VAKLLFPAKKKIGFDLVKKINKKILYLYQKFRTKYKKKVN